MDPIDVRPLAVGDRLHGFCGGYFGRDHYDCCTVEATGRDWVVVRNDDDSIGFASGRGDLEALRRYREPTVTTDGYDQPCCEGTT